MDWGEPPVKLGRDNSGFRNVMGGIKRNGQLRSIWGVQTGLTDVGEKGVLKNDS